LVVVRTDVVVLLTDTPVLPGWPVRVALEGPGRAGGPTAAATVLAATAMGADHFLIRLGLVGGRGAVAFLRAATARLAGRACP
jgi:hypothetical protein